MSSKYPYIKLIRYKLRQHTAITLYTERIRSLEYWWHIYAPRAHQTLAHLLRLIANALRQLHPRKLCQEFAASRFLFLFSMVSEFDINYVARTQHRDGRCDRWQRNPSISQSHASSSWTAPGQIECSLSDIISHTWAHTHTERHTVNANDTRERAGGNVLRCLSDCVRPLKFKTSAHISRQTRKVELREWDDWFMCSNFTIYRHWRVCVMPTHRLAKITSNTHTREYNTRSRAHARECECDVRIWCCVMSWIFRSECQDKQVGNYDECVCVCVCFAVFLFCMD